MFRARVNFVVVLLALAYAGCASARKDADSAQPSVGNTSVAVQNNYIEDMAIYVVNTSGGRWRLGTIMRATSGKVFIPPHMLTEPHVQLVALPIGPGQGRACPTMTIHPGSHVELILERELVYSNCWVR